jgi:hypothetical protein
VLTTLNHVRSHDGHALVHAHSAAAQSRAARALAGAHATAAAAVRALASGKASAVNAAVAHALSRVSRAYAALAKAAAHNDAHGYRAAQRAVAAGQSALTAALGQLRSLGYSVR